MVSLGVSLRVVFLLWAGELELWADEGQYVVQAVALERFGFYLGSPSWVWPPGYPAFLAACLGLFGELGLLAAKLVQIGLSAVIGVSVMVLARRLFSERAALVAGVTWALYMPLIAYTHYLWPETLFLVLLLPAVCLFLSVVGPRGVADGAPWRLALAGALIGGTLYLKEAALPLLVLLPLILVAAGERSMGERVAGAAVLVLGAVVVVLPWTLRNYEVYGRVVPSGSTVGENLWQGVNAHYINWDYGGVGREELVRESRAYVLLARPPKDAQAWPRSTAANTIDRSSESSAAARDFVRAHPGYYLRSRIKKLADWVTPLSFFVRHQRNGMYPGSFGRWPIRIPFVLWSLLATAGVLALGTVGLFASLPRGAPQWTVLAVVATFLASVAVVSMSRYRVQVEPFLIVSAAGLVSAGWPPRGLARTLGLVALGLLIVLWLLNAAEIAAVLKGAL